MKRQGGLTQFEFVVVSVVICLLIGTALYYYAAMTREVRRLGVERLASNFVTATAAVRARWILDGRSPVALHDTHWHLQQLAGEAAESVPVWVYVSEDGWPLATEPVVPGEPQTPERCYQLWQALLHGPPAATVAGREAEGSRPYHISTVAEGATCRYRLQDEQGRYHVDYTPASGEVWVGGRRR